VPETASTLDRFPRLLPLRSASEQRTGVLSDHGSWMGLQLGDQHWEIVDLAKNTIAPLSFSSAIHQVSTWPDRQEFRLADGREFRLGFASTEQIVLESTKPQQEVEPPQCSLPNRIVQAPGQTWRMLIGDPAPDAPQDIFEQNRARWNALFARAFANFDRPAEPESQVLLARSITTLSWNRRGATPGLPHAGAIPSPFGYRGFWATDSWRVAAAYAVFAPEWAAEQLRLQFFRQQDDGMVPDTCWPDAESDNWQNSKPPLAAWALAQLYASSGETRFVEELYANCAAQMNWFEKARRMPGELLFRAGGVDAQTAAWDSGWDSSCRFQDIPLQQAGSWKLLDLWQPDYNTACYVELRALAKLAEVIGEDAAQWSTRSDQLGQAIERSLWNEARRCFCDVRASSGASLGIRTAASWLPLWAELGNSAQRAMGIATMRDRNHFATEMPFPTLAMSERDFEPTAAWNGSVVPEFAAYAVQILGEDSEAERKRLRQAICQRDVMFDRYTPLDGLPAAGRYPAVAQSSGTAAAGVLVLHGGPKPFPLA